MKDEYESESSRNFMVYFDVSGESCSHHQTKTYIKLLNANTKINTIYTKNAQLI